MSDLTVDQRELARVFGVSPRTIQRWEDAGLADARVGSTATYDLPAAVAWRVEKLVAELNGDTPDLDAARARKESALAELRELEVGQLRGDLLEREEVLFWIQDWGVRIRQAAQQFVGRYILEIAAELGMDPRRVGPVLDRFVRQWLEEVADEATGRTPPWSGPGAGEPLPGDLPGRSRLVEAGVETLAELRALPDLEAVHGIGPATARKIHHHLEEMQNGHR